MARIKGATTADKAAHRLFAAGVPRFSAPAYCRRCGRTLETGYHEERLYSVACRACNTVTLVKACNPAEAAWIVGEPMPRREV